jgi:hypothetical protein
MWCVDCGGDGGENAIEYVVKNVGDTFGADDAECIAVFGVENYFYR